MSETGTIVLPAELVGVVTVESGVVHVGELEIQAGPRDGLVSVYMRRSPVDLGAQEIIIAFDPTRCASEEEAAQYVEADRYPLGEKEYWRSELVGKCVWGDSSEVMTDEDFEHYYECEG